MHSVILLSFLFMNTFNNCIDYEKVNNILEKIHIDMSEKDLYVLMNDYGWKEKKLGSEGLKLSTYKRILKANGDSVLQYAPQGYKRLVFKPTGNMNSIISIEVELSYNGKRVTKKYISKSAITLNEYEKVYRELPFFPDSLRNRLKIEQNVSRSENRGKCNGKEYIQVEQDRSNNPISIDSLLSIIHTCITDQEFMCTAAQNGWVWGRYKSEYSMMDTVIDPCGDTIKIEIPVSDYFIYSKKEDSKKIRAVTKDYKYVKLVSKIEVLSIGGEREEVWDYFNW